MKQESSARRSRLEHTNALFFTVNSYPVRSNRTIFDKIEGKKRATQEWRTGGVKSIVPRKAVSDARYWLLASPETLLELLFPPRLFFKSVYLTARTRCTLPLLCSASHPQNRPLSNFALGPTYNKLPRGGMRMGQLDSLLYFHLILRLT